MARGFRGKVHFVNVVMVDMCEFLTGRRSSIYLVAYLTFVSMCARSRMQFLSHYYIGIVVLKLQSGEYYG